MRSTRFSPITAGALVVALLVVVAEVALLRRPRRATETTAAPVPSEPLLPGPALGAREPPAAPTPPAPPTPPRVTQPAPVEVAEEAQAGADRAAVLQRRALLGAGQNQRLMQQVDEQLFVTSQMDELTRLAIRRINEDHARRLQALLDAGRADRDAADAAALAEAERARRAALDSLLGPEASRAFDMAEHMASRRVRPRYRRAWAEELRQQAPLPP